MRRGWVQTGKAIVSICLLCWFFTLIEPQSVLATFAHAALGPLCLAMLTMFLGLLVSVYKWRALLNYDGVDASFSELIRYYLIGIYCNNFLPTSIGGDAMRAWLASVRYKRGMAALTSVLAERLSGLIALLLVAGFFSLGGELFPMQRWLALILLLVLLLLTVLVNSLEWKRLLTPFPAKIRTKSVELLTALSKYGADRRTLWVMGWTSLIYPLLVGLVYFWVGRSIAVDVKLLDLVVISSLVTLLTLIPVSLNGLGLREGGFVFFLGQMGVQQEQALSLSLMVFGLSLFFSLIGGICLFFEKNRSVRRVA